ncbi:Map microtubule affinity-regulating kinase [Dinochytrium kinnereticum]|nr:Map microtubule affinity-regulating kinase [Dinochytrium kinnereticum]
MLARKKFLGNYQVLKTIGQGAFSKVKLGIHKETGQKVAIKIIDKKEMAAKANKAKKATEERERKRKEAEIQQQRQQQERARRASGAASTPVEPFQSDSQTPSRRRSSANPEAMGERAVDPRGECFDETPLTPSRAASAKRRATQVSTGQDAAGGAGASGSQAKKEEKEKAADEGGDTPSFMSTLQLEVQLLMRLDHPNVINLYQVMETEDECFVVMEYAAGGELIDYIAARNYLTEKEARRLFRQILSAMDHCHMANVVHRDLKLENLLLTEQKNILISDFGLGRTFMNDRDDYMKTFCGTPNYAAVELISGIPYIGVKADIWAMGVVLFVMMTGRPPFSGDNISALYGKIKAVDYKCPDYFSKELKSLLGKILRRDPKARIDMEGLRSDPWVNFEEMELPTRIYPKVMGPPDPSQMGQLIKSITRDSSIVVFTIRQHMRNGVNIDGASAEKNRTLQKNLAAAHVAAVNHGGRRRSYSMGVPAVAVTSPETARSPKPPGRIGEDEEEDIADLPRSPQAQPAVFPPTAPFSKPSLLPNPRTRRMSMQETMLSRPSSTLSPDERSIYSNGLPHPEDRSGNDEGEKKSSDMPAEDDSALDLVPSRKEIEEWHLIHRPPKEVRTVRYSFNPSLTSHLPPSQVFQDVHRVLVLLQKHYDNKLSFIRNEDYYLLRCKIADGGGDGGETVEFEVEDCESSKGAASVYLVKDNYPATLASDSSPYKAKLFLVRHLYREIWSAQGMVGRRDWQSNAGMSVSAGCVLTIKTCKKVNEHEALSTLKRVASLVKPLMKKRSWTLPILREFFPPNPNLLGLNVNRGQEIRLRLRHATDASRFLEFEDVLGTMLHELTHNAIGPHNAAFYKYLEELNLELDELRNKGWCGEGFDAPGVRVGMGVSRDVPESERKKVALQAAEKRAAVSKLMIPTGGRRLGGGRTDIEKRASPAAMAAIAAERRLRDGVWCGSSDDADGEVPFKRKRDKSPFRDGVKRLWVCLACTLENLDQNARCEACETPQPLKVVGSNNSGKDLGKPESQSAEPLRNSKREKLPWSCTDCGWTLNEASTLSCDACFMVRDDPPSSSLPPPSTYPSDEWACTTCTLLNSLNESHCMACDAHRPAHVIPEEDVSKVHS